jgi:hypothetical protein
MELNWNPNAVLGVYLNEQFEPSKSWNRSQPPWPHPL